MEADISSQAVGLASSADYSLVNLFIRADIIVKTVIILLIACSVYSWAIIIDKIKMFKKINISSDEFEEKFWRSKSAETFYNNLPSNVDDPMTSLFRESMQGLLKSKSKIFVIALGALAMEAMDIRRKRDMNSGHYVVSISKYNYAFKYKIECDYSGSENQFKINIIYN